MKDLLLRLLIILLIASGLIGIAIIVFGLRNIVTIKIMVTIAIFFAFCLPALTSASLYNKEKLKPFAITGIVINIIAALYFIFQLWGLLKIKFFSTSNLNISACLVITSISSAHISLLLHMNPVNSLIVKLRLATIIISIVFDLEVISQLLISVNILPIVVSEIIILLIVLFTILLPILNKYYENHDL